VVAPTTGSEQIGSTALVAVAIEAAACAFSFGARFERRPRSASVRVRFGDVEPDSKSFHDSRACRYYAGGADYRGNARLENRKRREIHHHSIWVKRR
jgi:hypothetical protein